MRVLITGGTGSVGRAATERLVNNGWDVRVIGRRAGMEIPGAEYVACDITSYDDLAAQAAGREAIVHLAALPSPGGATGPEVIRVNVLGTFNVFEAASKAGIRRVVQASSINAFGCWYGVVDLVHLEYFPIDEAHPTHTTDPYSFSKELIEDVGAYYWRRDGISSVALRLPWVHPRGHQGSDKHRRVVREAHAVLDEFAALPPTERLQRLAAAREKVMAFRRQRPLEFGTGERGRTRDAFKDDPFCRMYMSPRPNFWAFLDERDSAQAIEKALTADYEGSHALFVNDPHNTILYDTETLLGLLFPAVTGRSRAIRGSESLVSIERARDLIGFEPEYSVADALKDGWD